MKEALSEIILQHLQFLLPHLDVLLYCFLNARFLTFTNLFLRLGPVFLTNWNSLFLLGAELTEEVWFRLLPGDILETEKLGLADLVRLVLMFCTERWCVGVLERGP